MSVSFTSAWVQPDGRFIDVPSHGHKAFARERVPLNIANPVEYLESTGWLHIVTFGYGKDTFFHIFTNKTPSQSQLDTMYDLLMVAPKNMQQRVLSEIRRHAPDFMNEVL